MLSEAETSLVLVWQAKPSRHVLSSLLLRCINAHLDSARDDRINPRFFASLRMTFTQRFYPATRVGSGFYWLKSVFQKRRDRRRLESLSAFEEFQFNQELCLEKIRTSVSDERRCGS